MSNSWYAVTIDSRDAPTLARFWAAVMDREISEPESDSEHVMLPPREPTASEPRLVFNNVPEPKTVKNRVHLDIRSTSYTTEIQRLIGLGATRLWELTSENSRWTTFTDIEGNEFDLIDG
jgi:Glyoxalase-like domain